MAKLFYLPEQSQLQLHACKVDLRTGELSNGREGRLTSRELLLLERLVQDSGQLVGRDALLETFGYVPTTRSRAVDKTMANLRAKLESDPTQPVHLVTVYGQGYVFHPIGRHAAAPIPHDSIRLRWAPPDRFVGRARELVKLSEVLARPGLVTLVGPGGVGKTRLTAELLDTRSSPGVLVELASARTRHDLVAAVASALDLADARSADLDAVGVGLASRRGQLVVLDNLEHLTAFADVIAAWVRRAPETCLLGTSRQPLQLRGERVIRLEPLDALDAASLLEARADEAGHPIESPPFDALLGLLDGLPLALELAAARLDVYTPDELASRISQGRTRLRSVRCDLPSRFDDLDALLDWSWVTLTPDQRALLGDLSVFEGPFALPAAEAISGLPTDMTAEVLGQLLARSLLQRRRRFGQMSFTLLAIVRRFSWSRQPAEARDAAERRHARHFAGNAGRYDPDALPDLRAALDRTIDQGDGELAVRLLHNARVALWSRGPFAEAGELALRVMAISDLSKGLHDQARIVRAVVARWEGSVDVARAELQDVIERSPSAEAVALAQRSLGVIEREAGEVESAIRRFQQALELFRSQGARSEEADVLAELGITLDQQGDSSPYIEEALAIHRELGDRRSVCVTSSNLAPTHYRRGAVEEARGLFEEALALSRELGQRRTQAWIQGNLGVLHMDQGRFEEAFACLEDALNLHRELGNRGAEGMALMNLGLCLVQTGRPDAAVANLHRACDLFRECGHRRSESDALGNLGLVMVDSGDREQARPLLDRALALARESRNPFREALVLEGLADLEIFAGEIAAARDRLETALVIHQGMSRPRNEAICRYGLAWLEAAYGDSGRARAQLEQSLPMHEEVGNVGHVGLSLALRAVLDAHDGLRDEALRTLASAEARVAGLANPRAQAQICVQRAEVEAVLGKEGAARAALAEAERHAPGPRHLVHLHVARVREAYGLDA